MDIYKVIHVATEAGKIMLENGGETYRVEETILRICNAYNIKNADSFVTQTGIMISATSEYEQTVSLVKRIKKRTVDLGKVANISNLSRDIASKGLTLQSVEDELARINRAKKYNNSTIIFFSCIAAGFFTLLFGGSISDFVVSFIIGGIIKLLTILLSKYNVNDFFINVLGGSISATIAILAVNMGLVSHVDKIIIGSIMLLAPGLAITNAIRDTIAGDLLAGISRALEAFLTAIAIAVGTGIVLKIWFINFGGTML